MTVEEFKVLKPYVLATNKKEGEVYALRKKAQLSTILDGIANRVLLVEFTKVTKTNPNGFKLIWEDIDYGE